MWRQKSHAILLMLQIALTLAIVANAAFIIQNRLDLMNRDSGIPESEVFKVDVFSFGDGANNVLQAQLDQQALRAIPGVIDAVRINQIPISGSADNSTFSDNADREKALQMTAGVYRGDSHMINTFGAKLIEGRNFNEDEINTGDSNQPVAVAIVSKAFIETMFPLSEIEKLQGKSQQGLGKNIFSADVPIKIIGILDKLQGSNVNSNWVDSSIIIPKVQTNNFARYLVRTNASERQSIMDKIEKLMLDLYPSRVIMKPITMDEVRNSSYRNDRLMSQLLSILIVILLLVTALGIVGMAIFNVNRRTRQIGTRRALGASKANVIRYFIVENWIISTVGIVFGVVLTLFLNQFLMQQFSLPKLEYSYIVNTVIGIWLLGIFAVYLPARKASNISPAIATRSV